MVFSMSAEPPSIDQTQLAAIICERRRKFDAAAAELKILTPRSMSTVLKEIGSQFEANSGYKLTVVTGIAATLADWIIQGEAFDSELVAKGEIELGMVVTTQIMTTPGVELVGPIPREIQS